MARRSRTLLRTAGLAVAAAVLLAAVLLWIASVWYRRHFGDTGFDSIAFTLLFRLEGTETGLVRSFVQETVAPGIALFLALAAVLRRPAAARIDLVPRRSGRRIRLWPFPGAVRAAAFAGLCAAFLAGAADNTGFRKWLAARSETTRLYAERYVDPKGVAVAFPAKKRNLVVLCIESCETSLFSRKRGGAMPGAGLVPELEALAADPGNVNFSGGPGLGGWRKVLGTTWTAGALTALTTGVPFAVPTDRNAYGKKARFLPGAWALGDVLGAAGYESAFVIGSDGAFGGRDKLFGEHGMSVCDYFTAVDEGVVPRGYRKWWGFEDAVLYRFARKKILELAAGDKPFAAFVLTVDTHPPDGAFCDLCRAEHEERYLDVWSCASRQAGEFVRWLRERPFWDDTTVLVCGDHPCHDVQWARRNVPPGCPRRVYDCFLNAVPPAPPAVSKNRQFCAMDMYPTVLAAMGCTIPGERLGLGVNLFSGERTLCEELGTAALDAEIGKRSDEYLFKLVLGR